MNSAFNEQCGYPQPPLLNERLLSKTVITLFLLLFMSGAFAQNRGLQQPQDPATLPKTFGPVQQSIRKAKIKAHTILRKTGENEFAIRNGWEMTEASTVKEAAVTVSTADFNSSSWYNATVPGTVLTTLADQGVYPDPYWGLNNLYIPDTLCRQNWWYRVAFAIPEKQKEKECWLTFKGINYEARLWLNGHIVGSIKGAFKRGIFNVTGLLKTTGENILAVQIIPPPHPGIPHEQSVLAGRGPNGGILCLDGPTFISSEGWDWVPGIRDRNIGIWQDVVLKFTGKVTIADPQVITDLDLPDTSQARITIKTNLYNSGNQAEHIILTAAINGINIKVPVDIAAGENKLVELSPAVYPQLKIKNPLLWWPNGYGNPHLYELKLSVHKNAVFSDSRSIRFGIRELSYEMSVHDAAKGASRIEFNPTNVFSKTTSSLFNTAARHKATGETVIPELKKGAGMSLLQEIENTTASPYLVIKVNGVRIFCKGGNWGMDDGMKRTARSFLEPYFKLSRDAHFTMIRNWTGESTEEVFYELCDEYGLLVWNDFWTSTENYNVLPEDNQLFLENARDVLRRFRNHPSIAIWCPRNEGYMPEPLDSALAEMIAVEDGTRHYHANSRYMNLRPSGPWNYMKDPTQYYTRIAEGFNTELGTPSVPTAHTMRKMMAQEDLWPIGDVWHYHDFHFGQKDYVNAIDSLYGTAEGIDDFCKKAQLVNFDSHRAMFESWNSKLWENASGMLIWMSQPAWPSTVWQAYSYDYETFGSYYGSRNACEPVHIQQNLHDNKVIVVNTSLKNIADAVAKYSVFDCSGRKLYEKEVKKNVPANKLTPFFTPGSPENIPPVYLVRLQLTDSKGKLVSINDYWKTGSDSSFKTLNTTGQAKLICRVNKVQKKSIRFTLTNTSGVICTGIKLNLQNGSDHQFILPAYCSDGYFNLLPGESRELTFSFNTNEKKIHLLASAYNFTEKQIASASLQ